MCKSKVEGDSKPLWLMSNLLHGPRLKPPSVALFYCLFFKMKPTNKRRRRIWDVWTFFFPKHTHLVLIFLAAGQRSRHHHGRRTGVLHPPHHHREAALWPGLLDPDPNRTHLFVTHERRCVNKPKSSSFSTWVDVLYCTAGIKLWESAVCAHRCSAPHLFQKMSPTSGKNLLKAQTAASESNED